MFSVRYLFILTQNRFTDVLRANEYSTSLGVVTTTHTEYNLETSDFFRVYCESENGQYR